MLNLKNTISSLEDIRINVTKTREEIEKINFKYTPTKFVGDKRDKVSIIFRNFLNFTLMYKDRVRVIREILERPKEVNKAHGIQQDFINDLIEEHTCNTNNKFFIDYLIEDIYDEFIRIITRLKYDDTNDI
jgi:hypothetical protein